jgi:hypothetical protein
VIVDGIRLDGNRIADVRAGHRYAVRVELPG